MWTAISLCTILACFIPLLYTMRGFRGDRLTIMVIGLIWLRFALTSLGEIATRPVAAGQSLLAIGTLGATVAVLLVVPLERYRSSRALPFFGLIGLIVLSGVLNGRTGARLVDSVSLWTIFLVCALLLERAFELHGPRPVLRCLIAVFVLPVAMQAMSVAFGRPLVGMDGTINYVGNFVHEAVFSIVALAALWLVTIYPWTSKSARLLAFALALASLLLANYRTLIVACLPLLFALVVLLLSSGSRLRRTVFPMVLGGLLLAALVPTFSTGRFAGIDTVVAQFGSLIKPPQEYTYSEKRILSARTYIVASYVHDYVEGRPLQQIVGFGPGARARGISLHPHNEYMRMLFDFGIVGLSLWLGLMVHNMAIALRRIPHPAGLAVASGYAAILIGSLGTSFFNRPEGMILLALLFSVTWYLTGRRAPFAQHAGPQRLPEREGA